MKKLEERSRVLLVSHKLLLLKIGEGVETVKSTAVTSLEPSLGTSLEENPNPRKTWNAITVA